MINYKIFKTLSKQLKKRPLYHQISQFIMSTQRLKTTIGPSILSADFANLQSDCKQILIDGADSLHIDIMDGHFVPNLTIGPPVVKSLRKKLPQTHFDCHIMVTHPKNYIKQLKQAGANCITFHYQSQHEGLTQLCQSIKSLNIETGLSIKPKTQINQQIQQLIQRKLIDKILIMTVEPGFGGQKFMENMMGKVQYLRNKYEWIDIQVDGGITLQTIEIAAKSGANQFVSGSGIFGVKNKKETIQKMKEIANRYLK